MRDWESSTDDQVLAAAAADPSAFGVVYRRYERPMLAYFRRRTGDSELARNDGFPAKMVWRSASRAVIKTISGA